MFRKSSFQAQVMSLPLVAGIAFVALAIVSIVIGIQSGSSLQRIEKEFTPAVEISREMKESLDRIQRIFKDAAQAMDQDIFADAQKKAVDFYKQAENAQKNPVLNPKEIEGIKKSFEQYFKVASSVTERMIAQDESENLGQEIKKMSQSYNDIRNKLEQLTANTSQQRQAFLIQLARQSSSRSSYINIPIIVAALIIIVLMARSIATGTVKSLAEVASHLAAASAEILSLAEHTESNTANEASSVDETRHTMKGMLEAANEVGRGAKSVVDTAERSAEASKMIGQRINKLNMQAMKISDISETVRSIADKSDILALNASLEGTKAGEVGRGFALVGAEMRRLTETVMDAVREIKQLSNQIQDLSQAAVLASEEGQKIAVETTETARRITLVATQQRTATEQVTEAMDDIQEFTQQAVSGAKQAKDTANDLVRTANNLKQLMEGTRFIIKQTVDSARQEAGVS